MQPSSPSPAIALAASAEMRAVSLVVNPQAVVRVVRAVRVVASAAARGRCGAAVAGFGGRGGRGVPASVPVPKPSPNMAVKRDWPSAASVGGKGLLASSPSLPCVAASPLLLR
jgi:hypothetical protein